MSNLKQQQKSQFRSERDLAASPVSWIYHGIHQRCTTFLGQGPQHIIFSALEGRRQNYEL